MRADPYNAGRMIPHFERLTDSRLLPRWLLHEHEARYAFCRDRVRGKVVLDCGSGEGKGSRAIALGLPRILVAVDRSLAAVAAARTEKVTPVAGDAERLAARDRSVDMVVALEVIEHFDHPDAFLAEAARILRDDGMLICSTPNRTVRNPRLPLNGRPLNPWHIREWTTEEFRSMLTRAFGMVELFGQQPQSRRVTRLFDGLSSLISRRGAAIARQLVKIGLVIVPRGKSYSVQPLRAGADCEFIVAVCGDPRRP